MSKRLIALLGIAIVCGTFLVVQKYKPKKKSVDLGKVVVVAEPADSQSVAVLTAAQQECAKLKSGQYEISYHSEGSIAYSDPKITASVTYDKAADALRVSGKKVYKDGTERKLDEATDGKRVVILDHVGQMLVYGPYPFARPLMSESLGLVIPELGDENAFQTALTRSCKHEGVQDINGTMCDVVFVPQGHEAVRWFIGTEDNLPHRVERIVNNYPGNEGKDKMVLTITSITPRTDLRAETFVLNAPDGYEEQAIGASRPLLAIGSTAPNWELKSPSGERIKLEDLRGRVVVMDFWATWCGPCKMAMPGLQTLHEEMSSQGVTVVGIDCSESPGADPEGYMQRKKYTYRLLLQGDAVARRYRADGLPTIYVLDGKGTIVYAAMGYGNGMEKVLRMAVESALNHSAA